MSAKPAAAPKQKLPRLVYNPISAVGAALAVVAGLTFLALLGLSFYSAQTNPYFGIFMYMVLPPLLVVGLAMIPVGMLLRRRHYRKTGELRGEWPRIDLNDPRHRNAALIFVVGTLTLAFIMAISSYGAYHYSESVAVLRHHLPRGDGARVHGLPELPARPCRLRRSATSAGRRLVRQVEALGDLPDLRRGAQHLPAAHPDRRSRTCARRRRPASSATGRRSSSAPSSACCTTTCTTTTNTHWPIDLLIKTGGGDPVSGQRGHPLAHEHRQRGATTSLATTSARTSRGSR